MKFDESSLYNIESSLDGTRYSLFDLAIWKNGLAFKKIDFSETGRPVIKIAELNNGITSNTAFTEGDYDQNVLIRRDDLLFSWSGNPQTSIDVFRYRLEEGWLNQHIFKVTVNEKLVTKDYLYYILKSLKPYFTQIAKNKQTTGLGHVTIADLKRMSLIIPSKERQIQIGSILKAIDDKIEINTNINKNLLQQAMTLFVQTFIKTPLLGENRALYDFADYINGAAFKQDDYSPYGLPIIKIAELKNGITDSTQFFAGNKGDKYLVHDKDILFSWSGNPDTSIDIFLWASGDAILNQHTFNVKSKGGFRWFIYLLLKYFKPQFTHIAANKQTTGLGHVTTADLKRLTFIYNIDEIASFEKMIEPTMELIFNNMIENRNLDSLRNKLLPQLMSGEIDVSRIES